MRILLTGATGFVGRQVARHLVDLGQSPVCLVRPGKESPDGLQTIACDDLFALDAAAWRPLLDGFDTIIHTAWYTEPGKYLQSPRNLSCLAGTLRMAEAAMDAGVRRIVGIGTCFEYDLSRGYLATTSPLGPETPYAMAKAACWQTLQSVLPTAGLSFAWCRLFYLHGEGEHANRLVPYLHSALSEGRPAELTSGRQIRDFLDVSEAGRRIAAVALSDMTGAINICSGRGQTVAELATAVAERYGRTDLLRFGARPDNLTDPPCVIGEPTPIKEATSER